MRYFSCLLFFVLFAYSSYAQEKYTITGYVINVEEEKVYLDLSSAKVKVGDKVKVLSDKGYFIHPVTKRKIERAQEELATLSIVKVYDSYSEAIPVHRNDLKNIKVGAEVKKSMPIMSTSKMTDENGVVDVMRNVVTDDKDKISVFVAPAQVNDITGIGYFGTYVSDILMEQLMMCDKIRLLDRTVLGMQVDEIDLSGSEYVDASAAIQKGKMLGAERIIQVTMQKPDVVNIRTGIPLASIMGAVQGIANTNIGAQYMSNMQIATLKASVNISVRVIDIETGEVLFMCSSTGKAQGKSQLSMEYGALGGAELNGGAEGFKQTVTGKAIQHAFTRIGRNLNDYFNQKTDRRVMGSASGFGNYGQTMRAKGRKLYLGTEKLDKEGIQMTFAEKPELYFDYKKGKRMMSWSWAPFIAGVGLGMGIMAIDYDETCFTAGGMTILAGIGGSVYMQIAGRQKIKKVATQYNATNQHQNKAYAYQLGLAIDNKGVGIRFTF